MSLLESIPDGSFILKLCGSVIMETLDIYNVHTAAAMRQLGFKQLASGVESARYLGLLHCNERQNWAVQKILLLSWELLRAHQEEMLSLNTCSAQGLWSLMQSFKGALVGPSGAWHPFLTRGSYSSEKTEQSSPILKYGFYRKRQWWCSLCLFCNSLRVRAVPEGRGRPELYRPFSMGGNLNLYLLRTKPPQQLQALVNEGIPRSCC